jgi:DNA invertase Pin-like site-specific DNA recombinase
MKSTVRIGWYARVSSDRQAEERTIDSQVAALRERIQANWSSSMTVTAVRRCCGPPWNDCATK